MTRRVLSLTIFLAAGFLFSCGYLGTTERINSESPDPTWKQDDEPGPWGVIVYEHVDFRGGRQFWELLEGERHKLVDFVGWSMNDRISSIRLGERVGVALFMDREFHGTTAVYDRTINRVDIDINDRVSSLILFDRVTGGPLGIWIGDTVINQSNLFDLKFNAGRVRFLPLPQRAGTSRSRVDRLNELNDKVKWILIGPADKSVYRRSIYTDYRSGAVRREGVPTRIQGQRVDVSIGIWEHADYRGRSVSLPERVGEKAYFELKDYNFDNIASSIVVEEIEYRQRSRRWR